MRAKEFIIENINEQMSRTVYSSNGYRSDARIPEISVPFPLSAEDEELTMGVYALSQDKQDAYIKYRTDMLEHTQSVIEQLSRSYYDTVYAVLANSAQQCAEHLMALKPEINRAREERMNRRSTQGEKSDTQRSN